MSDFSFLFYFQYLAFQILTRRQASCVLLGLYDIPKNFVIDMNTLKSIDMVPFYSNDPNDPAAVHFRYATPKV